MPLVLILVGLALIITSAQDTYVALGQQVKKDFSGQGSFLYWAGAIVFLGMFGYVDKLRTFSIAFMSLVLLALFLHDKQFFQQLTQEMKATPVNPVASGPAMPSIQTQMAASQTATGSPLANVPVTTPGYLNALIGPTASQWVSAMFGG